MELCIIIFVFMQSRNLSPVFVLAAGSNRSLGLEMEVEKKKFVSV